MNSSSKIPWRVWAIWGLGATFFLYAFLQRVATSVMVPDLMAAFDVGASALGGLSAIYFYAYMAVQLPTGILASYWGPGRLLSTAALLSAAGGFIFATADSFFIAIIGKLLVGTGAGFGFVSTLRFAAVFFPAERMALLSGMTMMMGMAGGVIGQAPLAILVANNGWRTTMVGVATFSVFVACLIWLLADDQKLEFTGGKIQSPRISKVLTRALIKTQTWIIAGYGFFIVTTMFVFSGLWGVPYLVQIHKFSLPEAAFSASLILIGWGLMAPLMGWLSDRFRRRKPALVISALGSFATITPAVYVPELEPFTIKTLLLMNGISISGMAVCFTAAREHNDTASTGTTLALVNLSVIAAGAIMQPITGWLLDIGWSSTMFEGARIYSPETFQSAFITLPSSAFLALILALCVKETHAKQLDANV
ncbi:MAG: hypothetical protein CBB68_14150 [Rhodospirillaceae bacterium TMED8]|nr:MFS transporter [Magnetovibrio sp.]OUT48102.1 MAG: hypothetical protein CBB68_14150 [Rhodospirillaceae bacterium TMED8]|tara:strand:- start:225 stop:1490 length:1266 start_codon:yes stop_codon:yes gene_type:complete